MFNETELIKGNEKFLPLKILIIKKLSKETLVKEHLLKKIFNKWITIINLVYEKKETINKSFKLYSLLHEKYFFIKKDYFKKWFVKTTQKIILNINKINTAKIDMNIVINQCMVTKILENEEKQLDNKNAFFKNMLFGSAANLDSVQNGEKSLASSLENTSLNANSSKNSHIKNILLSKFIIKRKFDTQSKFFRIWKNSDWKYQSFSDIIEKYSQLKSNCESLSVIHYEKKAEFKKAYLEYDLYKKNLCSNCFDANIYDLDYMSLNLNENPFINEKTSSKKNEMNEKEYDSFNPNQNENKEDANEFFSENRISNINNLLGNYNPSNIMQEEQFKKESSLAQINSKFNEIQNQEDDDSDFDETKKIEFGMNGTQKLNFANKQEFMTLKNDISVKERIEKLEKRIQFLNTDYNKTKSINDELSAKKLQLIDMINNLNE